MSAQFKHVSEKKWGYDPTDVDPLIDSARTQFANPESQALSAKQLRNAQFRLVKGGYRISAVDAALDRLDEAFSARDAKHLLATAGHIGANEKLDELRSVLLGRASRGKRKAFGRSGIAQKGYSVRQVDALLAAIASALEGRGSIGVEALRQASFSASWNGYSEAQVDLYIDRAVEYLQLSAALA